MTYTAQRLSSERIPPSPMHAFCMSFLPTLCHFISGGGPFGEGWGAKHRRRNRLNCYVALGNKDCILKSSQRHFSLVQVYTCTSNTCVSLVTAFPAYKISKEVIKLEVIQNHNIQVGKKSPSPIYNPNLQDSP